MRTGLTIIFLLLWFSSMADTVSHVVKGPAPALLKTDTSSINIRSFDNDKLNTYKNDPAFDYSGNDKPAESFWARFWRWFWSLFENVNRKAIPNGFWKYTFIVIGLCAVVFIVLKLMGMDILQILTGKSKAIEIPYEESLENIHEISFEEEIEKAVSNKNYRLAVRLLYLNSLKELNDKRFINWQIDKTNAAYVNEISNADTQQQFKNLTHQFEYVWYGDFPVDSNGYQHLGNSFHDFIRKLS